MKKVEYSQLVKRKLLKIKKEILLDYGEQKAKEILTYHINLPIRI